MVKVTVKRRWHLLDGRSWSCGTLFAPLGVQPDTTRVPAKKSAVVQMPWVWGHAQHINSNMRFWGGSSGEGLDGSCSAVYRKTWSGSLAKLAQCQAPQGLLPLSQQN